MAATANNLSEHASVLRTPSDWGAVYSSTQALAEQAKCVPSIGRNSPACHVQVGTNASMDPTCSAYQRHFRAEGLQEPASGG